MLESAMFINKFSYIIIAITFCFLTLNPAVSSGSDNIGDYDLDEILIKVEEANSQLETMEAEIKYSRVITLLDSSVILLHSVVQILIVPMQDFLMLDSNHRMNVPGVADGNWTWQFQWAQVPEGLADKIRVLLKQTDRLNEEGGQADKVDTLQKTD